MEDTSQALGKPDRFKGPLCVDGSFIVKHNYGVKLAGDIWVGQQLGKASVSVSAYLLNGKWASEEISVGPTGQVVYGSLYLEGRGMIKASFTYVQSRLHIHEDANYVISGAVIVNGDVKVARGSVLQVDNLVVLGDLHVQSKALLTARKVTVSLTTIVEAGGQLTADEMSGGGRMRINLGEE
ncbi:hypothetical protein DL768_008756 [Monosporascus sp. mg162]|nr:hypothetical protein DL768_008756 [Monosporascus sp. mg162]